MPTASKKTAKKRLILLDSHAIIHRAYHALPDFESTKGESTGGLYGLSTMLMKAINDLKPDYIVACYDRAEATFRKEAYGEYKAGRKKADDALIAQLIRSRDIFTAFNIPVYDKAGFEADDIIGTIAEQTKKIKDLEVIIASGDMDTMQLVEDKRVEVYTLRKGLSDTVFYDEKAVRERFGFAPALLVDYKGLRGDPSDNIIGIPGIGEKTATTIIQKFGSMEDIYKKLKKDPSAFKKAGLSDRIISLLKDHEEEALFSKMLATIRRDVPIEFKLEKTWHDGFDMAAIEKLFRELEFKSLIPRAQALLPKEAGKAADTSVTESLEADPARLKRIGIALWLINSDMTTPTQEDISAYAETDSFDQAEERILKDLKELGLGKVYEEIELPLIPIIAAAETRGILVDKNYLAELSKKYHKELEKYEREIYKLAGQGFNINSPKQLGEVLFDKMKISVKGLRKTAGGAQSTRESELEKLREGNPIIAEILEYRGFQKNAFDLC